MFPGRVPPYPQNVASMIPFQHPTQFRQKPKPDPFYGQETLARLCGQFITHLFTCPDYPPSSSGSTVKLPQFIAYAIYRTKLPSSVTFAALILLQRLIARFPTARGTSGNRLFLSAFMIASKIICDDTYSNKSWSTVGQGMFQLREINQMEREMCTYLDWELNFDPKSLREFEQMIRNDFSRAPPYPTYVLRGSAKPSAQNSSGTTRHINSCGILLSADKQDSTAANQNEITLENNVYEASRKQMSPTVAPSSSLKPNSGFKPLELPDPDIQYNDSSNEPVIQEWPKAFGPSYYQTKKEEIYATPRHARW